MKRLSLPVPPHCGPDMRQEDGVEYTKRNAAGQNQFRLTCERQARSLPIELATCCRTAALLVQILVNYCNSQNAENPHEQTSEDAHIQKR
jgi:hypothetical protein